MTIESWRFVGLSLLGISICCFTIKNSNAQEFHEHFTSPYSAAGFRSGIYHAPFYYFVGQYVDTTSRVHTIAYKVHPNGNRIDSLDIAFPNANTYNGWYGSSFWSIAEDCLIIVGSTWDSIKKNTLLVIKADENLQPIDTLDLLGLDRYQAFFKGIEDTDSSYLFIGQSKKRDTAFSDMLFMRLSHDGTILTEQYYSSPRDEGAFGVDTIPGGGIYLTGITFGMGNGNGQYPDIVLYKLDTSYSVVWRKIIGNYYADFVYDLSTTKDSGVVIGGLLNTEFSGTSKGLPYLAKYSYSGNLEWDTLIEGSPADGGIQGLHVLECGDILGCGLHYDLDVSIQGFGYIFRADRNGVFRTHIIDTGKASGGYSWRDIRPAPNEGIVLAGLMGLNSGPNANESQFWIRKIDSIASMSLCDDSLDVSIYSSDRPLNEYQIYPNPNSGILNVIGDLDAIEEITIYNSFGQLIHVIHDIEHGRSISIDHLPAGNYFISIRTVNSLDFRNLVVN